MLSDEEKKAIESLKNISIYMGDNYTFSQQGIRNLRENLRIVLPVIETQSKEIEVLEETLKCTQNSWFEDTQKIEEMKKQIDLDNECEIALNNKIMDLENAVNKMKEGEE